MIARIWTGTVRRADADEYAEYIRETGFAEYGHTRGNRGAWMLRRDEGERTKFITLSLWESEDAIRAFAGGGHRGRSALPRRRALPNRRRIEGRSLRGRRRSEPVSQRGLPH
jgi:heme-degrading monooxygenase HmoA